MELNRGFEQLGPCLSSKVNLGSWASYDLIVPVILPVLPSFEALPPNSHHNLCKIVSYFVVLYLSWYLDFQQE